MHLRRGGSRRRVRSRAARWTIGIIGAVLVLALVAVAGIGWYFSGVAVALSDHRLNPSATIQAVVAGGTQVQVSRTVDALRPEPVGLEGATGYGRWCVTARTATSVTRAFTPLAGHLAAGDGVSVDVGEYPGDPRSALGLAFEDVVVHSDVGALPVWYVPGADARGTWVVFVHGHDSSRRESLRYLTALHDRALPVLVPTYRNDVGAPRSPDGEEHLGDTEWRDVEAAVRWGLDHGARDVVLFGWSMGAAVSLQLADRSSLRDSVRGLVLDSPVLDWTSVLDHQGRLRDLPAPVTKVAEWMVGLRLGTGLDRFDWASRAAELPKPMLIVHSDADGYVPDGPSLALARARPDLVTYLDIPGADHTRGWNVDPVRYRTALDAWLTRQGVGNSPAAPVLP